MPPKKAKPITNPLKIAKALLPLAVPLAQLRPDPNNANEHSATSIAGIKGSLERFGQMKAIVATEDGIVRAGNGTLAAAKAMGATALAVVYIPQQLADQYAIADNQTGRLSAWNPEQLKKILDKVRAQGVTAKDLGFQDKELKAILDRLRPRSTEGDDVIPKAPRTTKIKRGDLFVLGQHRLLCGDSTAPKDVERLLNRRRPALVLTDPPYGIGFKYEGHDDSSNKKNEKLVADVFKLLPYPKVWTPGLANLARDVSRFGAAKVLVWSKRFAQMGNGLGGASTWEPILVLEPKVKALNNDVLEIMVKQEVVEGRKLNELHPCPKPLELMLQLAKAFTNPGDLIIDPFGGSGTTLLAGDKVGRVVYAMDKEPIYCDVIIQRWELATKLKAEKL